MSADWTRIAADFWNAQPHPLGHGLTIGEFPIAVKLATAAKFGGHATALEAGLFWKEFKATGMSPEEFTQALDRLAPLSFAYHGRPPTMPEIAKLKDEHPKVVKDYFSNLPDKHYPHVSAGEMVASLQAAEPHSQRYLGRPAVKLEAAYLHHSKEPPMAYYQRISEEGSQSADQTGTGDDAGGRRMAPSGGQATNE